LVAKDGVVLATVITNITRFSLIFRFCHLSASSPEYGDLRTRNPHKNPQGGSLAPKFPASAKSKDDHHRSGD